jgi:hypothetical protein
VERTRSALGLRSTSRPTKGVGAGMDIDIFFRVECPLAGAFGSGTAGFEESTGAESKEIVVSSRRIAARASSCALALSLSSRDIHVRRMLGADATISTWYAHLDASADDAPGDRPVAFVPLLIQLARVTRAFAAEAAGSGRRGDAGGLDARGKMRAETRLERSTSAK